MVINLLINEQKKQSLFVSVYIVQSKKKRKVETTELLVLNFIDPKNELATIY